MATNSPPSGSSSCLFSNVSIRPLETRFPCSDHHDPRDPHHVRWKDSATLGRIWNRESGTPEFKAPCAPRRLSRRQAPKQESDTHCAVSLATRPGGPRSGRTAPPHPSPALLFTSSLFPSSSPPPRPSQLSDWKTSLSHLGKGQITSLLWVSACSSEKWV